MRWNMTSKFQCPQIRFYWNIATPFVSALPRAALVWQQLSENLWQKPDRPQSLKYLLSGPLQKEENVFTPDLNNKDIYYLIQEQDSRSGWFLGSSTWWAARVFPSPSTQCPSQCQVSTSRCVLGGSALPQAVSQPHCEVAELVPCFTSGKGTSWCWGRAASLSCVLLAEVSQLLLVSLALGFSLRSLPL